MKVKFKIYQVKDIRDCNYVFRGWDLAKKDFNFEKDYKQVFKGEMESSTGEVNEVCDMIYRNFNRVTDEDCKRLEDLNFYGRSLSVSDIVVLENEENTVHYCDSFGWQTISL